MVSLTALGAGLLTGAILLSVCVAIEHVAPIDRYTLKARLPGLTMWIVGAFLGFALMWPVQELWKASGIGAWIIVPLWDWLRPLGLAGYVIHFLAVIAFADFLAYWRHRAEHSRWLWPVHAVHHAPTELHAVNSLGHPVQGFFSFAFIAIPISLIQFPGPETPVALGMLVSFLALYIHSPVDFHFGKLNRLVVDNRFHRIHHSLEPKHFDRNFGICFSCWDYLFGTAYTPEPGEWPPVGLADVEAPRNVRDFLHLPFPLYQRLVKILVCPTDQATVDALQDVGRVPRA